MTFKIPLAKVLNFAAFIEEKNIRALVSYQVETFFATYVVIIVSILAGYENDTTPDEKERLILEAFGQYLVTTQQLQNL